MAKPSKKPEEPSSWQDKLGTACLTEPHEDPLVQKVAAANGLPFPAESAVNQIEHDQLKGAFDSAMREIDRLKRMIRALEINGKKLERALHAEKVQRLDAEIEVLLLTEGEA
jgi:hypothetical protein